MVVELYHLLATLAAVNDQLVVVAPRGNVVALWTPLQPAYLLRVGLVALGQSRPEVPTGNQTVPGPTGQQPMRPVKAADPAVVTLKIGHLLSPGDIEHLDLPVAVSNGNFVLVAKGHRTDIVVDLARLV